MLKAAARPPRDGRPRPASAVNFSLSRVYAEGRRPGAVLAGLLFAISAMRSHRCLQIGIRPMALLINTFAPMYGGSWFLRPCQTKRFPSIRPALNQRTDAPKIFPPDPMFLFPRPLSHFARAEPDDLKEQS
jgi:hypothetical protein